MVMRNKLRNQRTESREALGVEPLKHMILLLINSFVMNVNLCMDSDHKHSHTCTGKCYFKYCFRVNSYKRSKLRDFYVVSDRYNAVGIRRRVNENYAQKLITSV